MQQSLMQRAIAVTKLIAYVEQLRGNSPAMAVLKHDGDAYPEAYIVQGCYRVIPIVARVNAANANNPSPTIMYLRDAVERLVLTARYLVMPNADDHDFTIRLDPLEILMLRDKAISLVIDTEPAAYMGNAPTFPRVQTRITYAGDDYLI